MGSLTLTALTGEGMLQYHKDRNSLEYALET